MTKYKLYSREQEMKKRRERQKNAMKKRTEDKRQHCSFLPLSCRSNIELLFSGERKTLSNFSYEKAPLRGGPKNKLEHLPLGIFMSNYKRFYILSQY
jgi:aldehyde:ferredoxin oxidoreductase